MREGAGDRLAEGVRRVAASMPASAGRFALEVKGLEMVSFDPRANTGLALGYALAPIGPRYDIVEHDWDYDDEDPAWTQTLDRSRTLGILRPIRMEELSPARIQLMRLYDLRGGIGTRQDTLPARFFEEAMGVPRNDTLVEHHLDWALPATPQG